MSVKTNGDFQHREPQRAPAARPGRQAEIAAGELSGRGASGSRANRGAAKASPPGTAELRRVEELERELAYTRENLQATIEEQQASNEELKSTNEELQSTNEELQSTNEELETSKEELQSVNEELVTVNAELQAKIEQLAGMQNDMKNLLDNINIGTIFLDQHLAIKRFTREAAQVYRLVATDVGRPLADIKSNIEGRGPAGRRPGRARFPGAARARGAHRRRRLVPGAHPALPHAGQRDRRRGADLHRHHRAHRRPRRRERMARELAESIVDTVREPLIVLDGKLKVISASRSFYRDFQVTPEETVGRPLYDLGNRQWDIPDLRELLETTPVRRCWERIAAN